MINCFLEIPPLQFKKHGFPVGMTAKRVGIGPNRDSQPEYGKDQAADQGVDDTHHQISVHMLSTVFILPDEILIKRVK